MTGRRAASLNRIKKLRKKTLGLNAQAYLATTPSNIHYLTADPALDYTPLALLISVDREPTLWVESMGSGQAERKLRNCHIETVRREMRVEDCLAAQGVGREKVFFDELTYSRHQALRRKLPHARLIHRPDIPRTMREIKDQNELRLVRRAVSIADAGMAAALEAVRSGVTEFEVAAEAEYAMRRRGSEGTAFSTIVASGARSAVPHANPTVKKLREGDAVVIDMGTRFQGYCSDLTRTTFVGRPTSQQAEVYRVVYEAQQIALRNICLPMDGRRADSLAREFIEGRGYGKYFIHGLGHGVGLDIHEAPILAAYSRDRLRDGNVITVEPGIYLPNRFGVRLEDTALVRGGRLVVLSRCEKRNLCSK